MKERPILFSAPMVRAILEDRKTQTRRVVKQQPEWTEPATAWVLLENGHSGPGWYAYSEDYPEEGALFYRCPYGQPGDQLWVRETWRIRAWDESRGAVAIDYKAGGHCLGDWIEIGYGDDGAEFDRYWIQSTEDAEKAGLRPDENGTYEWKPGQSPCRWRPSIHMPRWASRILLEITAVRVERLQDISEADARSEGIADGGCLNCGEPEPCGCADPKPDARDAFARLWHSINGEESWHSNPWVWVIEFKRVTPNATSHRPPSGGPVDCRVM